MQQQVLITGCASGFGLHSAIALAEAGDRVHATVRDSARAPELLAARDSGLNITIHEFDVTDPDRTAIVVARVLADGGIDALVNNAGVSMYGAAEETSVKQYRDMMEVNFFGPVRLVQLVLPHMRERRSGRIVNVSSIGGYAAVPYMTAYDASKHALDAFSLGLAAEVAEFGVKVLTVSPGGFKTGIGHKLWRPALDSTESTYGETALAHERMRTQIVGDRSPEEAARAIAAAVHDADPSVRTFVGHDALATAERRRSASDDEWVEWLGTRLATFRAGSL